MKSLTIFAAVLAAMIPLGASDAGAQGKKAAARTVTITGTDSLKFTPATINARPGERLKVILKVESTLPKIAMAHNFVLPQPGVDIQAFITASATSPKTEYIAPAYQSKLLASTKLAGKGETVETEFNAPAKAGSYIFVCTFPGHFQGGMKGQLVVK